MNICDIQIIFKKIVYITTYVTISVFLRSYIKILYLVFINLSSIYISIQRYIDTKQNKTYKKFSDSFIGSIEVRRLRCLITSNWPKMNCSIEIIISKNGN